MLVNEIRFGNYIQYKSEPIKVVLIGEYGVQGVYKDRVINTKFRTPDLSGIPITRESLLKIGFYESKRHGFFINESIICIQIDYVDKEIILHIQSVDKDDWLVFDVELKYIHQVQNLCFDLTGKELEINL
jgi:hypothetical protein